MSTMTSKGQVTVPKNMRDHLGLKPGSQVSFELTADGRVVLKSAGKLQKSRFAKVRGTMKRGLSTEELMALTRGDK